MPREDRTIDQFCTRLSLIERQEVVVVSRHDRENPGRGGCDAIIERGGRRFALEHTTVDAIAGQRADDARFRQVVVPLERAIQAAHPDSWTLISVPTHAIPSDVSWGAIAEALLEGCIRAIAQMPYDGRWQQFEFQGVPFPVLISRRRDPRDPACHVMRVSPGNLEAHLENNMAHAIGEKRGQLAPYRRQGLSTILLLDSDEFVLTNRDSLADAFRRASTRENTDEFDEVFLAVTFLNPIWIYPLKLDDRLYPELPEFEQFFDTQCILTYGDPP